MSQLSSEYDFDKTRQIFKDSISAALSACERESIIDGLKTTYEKASILDADKRSVCDQAFRDILLENVRHYSASEFELLIHLSLESAKAEICSLSLPVVLLTDAFDILPLNKCEEIFSIVENKVSIWKQQIFFNTCKNTLLRLCNDLLRRLSRSQNTVFCGKILLFLAKFFPFSERSGLNVVSEFNLDNLTTYGVKDESASLLDTSAVSEQDAAGEPSFRADYNLYKKFWSLQDFFRNPNQCYTKIPWKMFCSHTNDVLSAFSTIKLEERRQDSKPKGEEAMEVEDSGVADANPVQQYFAKYLTSQNLLELQLGDSNFRRYVLLQFLIMFQYLEAPVKFKQETQKLSDEQIAWVNEAVERIYRLLEDTPPNGADFASAIRHILKREELWCNWKNEGCPEFRPLVSLTRPANGDEGLSENPSNGTSAGAAGGSDGAPVEKKTSTAAGRPRRMKRSLGDQLREAVKKNKSIIGNTELTRLWNLCPDNMESCRSKERDFLPSLEAYFEEAIEQLDPSVESQYKRINDANFGWRALRLLARRSPHFFTHGNTPITRLPDYLETHVKKLAKEFQSSSAAVNVKAEPVDEPEVEQMEPESEATTNDTNDAPAAATDSVDDSAAKFGDEGDVEDESIRKKPILCSMDQLIELSKKLGASWKNLAPKLGFRPDEVEYFESENSDLALQAKAMFQIWLENEPDATPENLLYTLEGLGLHQHAQGILN